MMDSEQDGAARDDAPVPASTAPGDGTAAPGDGTAPPGDGTAAPGDGAAAPGDGAAAPGDRTAARGDGTDRLYRAAWCMLGTEAGAANLVKGAHALVLRRHRRELDPEADMSMLFAALRAEFIGSRRFPGSSTLPATAGEAASDSEPGAEVGIYIQISALPAKLRDAVIAVAVMGLTHQQATQALGVREATLTRRLNDGYALLAAEGHGSSAGSRPREADCGP